MSWQEHRHAPALGQLLCTVESVPDNGCAEVRLGSGDDAFAVLLYRRDGHVRAYVNSCPHFSLPLNARPGEFLLLNDAKVMCAWHCAIFRLDDGLCIDGPAEGMALEPIQVEVRDSQVFVARSA